VAETTPLIIIFVAHEFGYHKKRMEESVVLSLFG
jgi:hypothetical protein